MWKVRIFTLYPDFFLNLKDFGIFKRAFKKKAWSIKIVNVRDFAKDKHKTVDDSPYGGGAGMILKPNILENSFKKMIKNKKEKIIYLSPRGKVFDRKIAQKFSKEKNINILCGHFEGIDQRVLNYRKIEEISLGDYILSSGESASIVFMDAIIRLLPGVLGNKKSLETETFENNLLEYDHYTKPRIWAGKKVPNVLLSGNHAKIKDWRLKQSEVITRRLRPDLWQKYKKKK